MKKTLKLIAFLLLLSLSLGCLAACSSNETETEVDTENFDGFVVSVVNKTEKDEVVDTYGIITKYEGNAKEIVIPAVTPKGMKITAVAGLAFYNNEITKLTVSEGITLIDNFAFGYCKSLTDVIIPSTVTKIGDYAFVNCYELRRVTINTASAPELGSYAFKNFVKDSEEDDPYEISGDLKLYVNDVEGYKADKKWKDYSDCFKKI